MRNIEVPSILFLIPGTYVWMWFKESGWVPANVVDSSNADKLYVDLIFQKKIICVSGWLTAMRQDTLIICPN